MTLILATTPIFLPIGKRMAPKEPFQILKNSMDTALQNILQRNP